MKKRIFALAIVLLTTVLILTLASCNEGGGETTPKAPNDNVGGDGGNNDDNNENNNDNNGGNNNENNNGNNGDGGESHVHAYGEWETVKAPTCKESGERSRSCECGEKQTEALEIVAHTESDWIVDKAATATEKGTRRKKCTLCGEKLAEEEIPATGSIGLAYEKNSDNTYTITGIGTCTDTEIYIPEYIDGGKVTAIDDEAFKGNKTITSVSIPGVYYIGESAFEFCTALTEVKIGYGTEYIGASAFMNCTSLVSIELPKSLETISEDMLLGCESLERLEIPSGVTRIDDGAFMGLIKLSYLSFPASVKSVGNCLFGTAGDYFRFDSLKELHIESIAAWCALDFNNTNEGHGGDRAHCNPFVMFSMADGKLYVDGKLITAEDTLVIPEGVTRIGKCAFEYYPYTLISVPDSINSVDLEAFESFMSYSMIKRNEYDNAYYLGNSENPYVVLFKAKWEPITSCTIHPDTKVIMAEAFKNRTQLTSIEIPEDVVSIGDRAFSGCTSLLSVTIKNPETQIGENAFANCPSHPAEPEPVYTEYEGAYYIGEGDNPYAILVKSKERSIVRIHPDTKKIADSALIGATLKPIKDYVTGETPVFIPNGVEYIGKSAFCDCDFMFNWDDRDCRLVIPDSVTYIGKNAFVDIGRTYRVTVSKNVEVIEAEAFSNCIYLKEVTIPEGVKVIGDRAFYDCRDLESLILPEGLESIGSEAFYNIGKITDLILPDSLKSIGEGAFKNWASLITVTVGKSVETIGTDAFDGCERITEIYNRSSLTIIPGTRIFGKIAEWARGVLTEEGEVSGLVYQDGFILYDAGDTVYVVEYVGDATEVVVPETVNGRKVKNYVIGRYAFYRKSIITSVVLPKCVTKIEECAFSNCNKLANINLPDGIKHIGNYAFAANALTEIVIPRGVGAISANAFRGCSKLTSVKLHEGVTEIGEQSFYNCTALVNVELADGLVYIGYRAFEKCSKLESILIPGSVTEIKSSAFKLCEALNEVSFSEGLKTIGSGAFSECYNLEAIVIPNGVESIGNSAFENCYKLTSVTISDSVTSMGDSVFRSCESLKYVVLSKGVACINSRMFEDCRSLEEIVIPEGVTEVSYSVFYNCTNFKSITLPSTLTTLRDCLRAENLTSVTFMGTVEQWEAIDKHIEWQDLTCDVVCTNGTVTVTPQ